MSLSQLVRADQDKIRQQYGDDDRIMVSDRKMSGSYAFFLGTVDDLQSHSQVELVDGKRTRFVYRVDPDLAGTEDLFLEENATLSSKDRAVLLSSLDARDSSVDVYFHEKTDMFSPERDGSFRKQKLCVIPDNQVSDLSYGFNFNLASDVQHAGRSLCNGPRLVVLNAWLHEELPSEDKLRHLDKVISYAKYQNKAGHGFIVICERPTTRVDQVDRKLESLTELSGVHCKPVGGPFYNQCQV